MFLRRKSGHGAGDEVLAARLGTGDRAALGHLWDRYAHLLFGVAMKYLKDTERSKDAVAELFTDLPGLLARHRVERFRPWLHTVLRNRCLLALRGHRRDAAPPDDLLRDTGHDETGEALLREATLQRLEGAIEQLNEGQRTCVRLFYMEHHSYQEVSGLTGLPVGQVRSHLQNGRRNLRTILQQHDDQNGP